MRIPGIPYHQGRNSYSDRDGKKYGIAIHNTSNTASDTDEANYADHRTDGVSAHLYVDGDSVTQSLDTAAKAGHAGSAEGNEHAVAVEITGLNSWSRQRWLDNVAWDRLGYALAYLIKHGAFAGPVGVRRASVAEMKANPRVGAFYGHDDMRLAWGGTDHTDPGPNFPWDRLFSAVNAALSGTAGIGDSEMDAIQAQQLQNVHQILLALVRLQPVATGVTVAGYSDATGRAEVPLAVQSVEVRAAVTALRSVVEQLAAVITASGGSVDTVAILAGVDERLAVLAAEQRDAVADLGEGGAAQVRADT